MIEWIVRLTAIAVAAVVLVDLARGAWLTARLAQHLWVKYRHLGLRLWLPVFESRRDALSWLATWRGILRSGDPVVAAIRRDGLVIAVRYGRLAVISNAWAMAVTVVA